MAQKFTKTISREITLEKSIKGFKPRTIILDIGPHGITAHEKGHQEARKLSWEQVVADILFYGRPADAASKIRRAAQ